MTARIAERSAHERRQKCNVALSIALSSPLALAQDQGRFEKKNFSSSEWTKALRE
jgi:hypothetical protein